MTSDKAKYAFYSKKDGKLWIYIGSSKWGPDSFYGHTYKVYHNGSYEIRENVAEPGYFRRSTDLYIELLVI